MKKIIHVLLGCLITAAAVAADSSAQQFVEMRLVVDKPSDDAEQMSWHNAGTNEVLFVEKLALLDQTDLKAAAYSINPPKVHPRIGIVFTFTDKGAKHLAEVTGRINYGHKTPLPH